MAKHERNGLREQHWRGVIARFSRSGLSVRAFCQREQVPESAFYFWRRTLQDRDAARATQEKPTFLPLALPTQDPTSPAADLCIELRGGVMIRVGDSVDIERVATLVRALRAQEPRT